MSLRQAVDTAIQQSPEIALSRLEAEKARQAIRLARDPFFPRLVTGSGLAYSNGFPMSIEGSAPSVIQAQAIAYIFNRPQSYQVAVARENARGAVLASSGKRGEVAWRVAALYLDAERAARIGELARKEVESQQKVFETVQARVREGRALPLAEKQAALNVARARQAAGELEDEQAAAETALAVGIGLGPEHRVRPNGQERPAPELPSGEGQAQREAVESSKELRQLESQMVAKGLEVRGAKSARLPRADLLAQYSMLAKFNNYDEFFRKFQRNNGQVGVSFQIPLSAGPGVSAQTATDQAEIARLRIQLADTRNRITTDVQQSFRELRKAETAEEVARLDLDVAREQLSVDLARIEEGRLGLGEVEAARVVENQKWIAFYDARYAVEKARWGVLRLTGGLIGAIDSLPEK